MDELQVGEHLQTRLGPMPIASIEHLIDPQPVYNLEVNGQHVYEVSELDILVHNTTDPWCRFFELLEKGANLTEDEAEELAKLKRLREVIHELQSPDLSGKAKKRLREEKNRLKDELGVNSETPPNKNFNGIPDPNETLQDFMQRMKRSIATLRDSPNWNGPPVEELLQKSLQEISELLTEEQWHMLRKHLFRSGEDLSMITKHQHVNPEENMSQFELDNILSVFLGERQSLMLLKA